MPLLFDTSKYFPSNTKKAASQTAYYLPTPQPGPRGAVRTVWDKLTNNVIPQVVDSAKSWVNTAKNMWDLAKQASTQMSNITPAAVTAALMLPKLTAQNVPSGVDAVSSAAPSWSDLQRGNYNPSSWAGYNLPPEVIPQNAAPQVPTSTPTPTTTPVSPAETGTPASSSTTVTKVPATPTPQPIPQPALQQTTGTVTNEALQKAQEQAVGTLDQSINELRSIVTSSPSVDVQAIALSFMTKLDTALASIQKELQDWYNRLGKAPDLGLEQAIGVLREEIEYQRNQLAENLNARGLLQSGILAAAEAKLRSGGLDRVQALVANRLNELQGTIIQTVGSLAQTRMAGLTQIATQGLQSVTNYLGEVEATRRALMSKIADLSGQKASAYLATAENQANWQATQQRLAQERQQWVEEAGLKAQELGIRQQEAENTRQYQTGLLDLQKKQAELQAASQVNNLANQLPRMVSETYKRIDSRQFTQAEFDDYFNYLKQFSPELANTYKSLVDSYMRAVGYTPVRYTPRTSYLPGYTPEPESYLPTNKE